MMKQELVKDGKDGFQLFKVEVSPLVENLPSNVQQQIFGEAMKEFAQMAKSKGFLIGVDCRLEFEWKKRSDKL